MWITVSANDLTQYSLGISEGVSHTKDLPPSASFIHCGLFSLSRSIAQTLWLFSANIDRTDLLIVNISNALAFSCPFNLNPEKWSPLWSLSKEIQTSIIDSLQSQAVQMTKVFLSNDYPLSHSYGISRLWGTLNFLSELHDDEKASLASVKVTPGATSGGGLVALIAVSCIALVVYRKVNVEEAPEHESKSTEEFDLPTEHSDDEEESVFDFRNSEDRSNSDRLLDWERWKHCRARSEDFDGEESF
jgi:hypothetical protein